MNKRLLKQRPSSVAAITMLLILAAPAYAADGEGQTTLSGRHAFENKCAMCHAAEKSKGTIVGPNLAGVYERKVGKLPSFAYSAALQSSNATWNAAALDAFLKSPQTAMPGTAMPFSGIKNDQDRAALIDYLKSLH